MIFYKRFLSDYANDTSHLDYIQHGAYGRLLDYYYKTEQPIPDDKSEMYRKLCAHTAEERTAIDVVLSEFFELKKGKYFCKRADAEIKKYYEKIRLSKLSGRKGGIKRQAIARLSLEGRLSERSSETKHSQSQSQSQNQSQIREEKVKVSCAPKSGARLIVTSQFEIFWNAYPRKEGKKAAIRTWVRMGLDDRLGEILGGLKAWEGARDPTYMPYAQGWLNAESWKERPLIPVEKKGGIDESELERIRSLRR